MNKFDDFFEKWDVDQEPIGLWPRLDFGGVPLPDSFVDPGSFSFIIVIIIIIIITQYLQRAVKNRPSRSMEV